MDPGPAEIVIILAVIVLLFGAKRLPELARSVGGATGEFKKGIREGDADDPGTGAGDGSPGPKPEA